MTESIRKETNESLKKQLPGFWLRLAGMTVLFLAMHLEPITNARSKSPDVVVVVLYYLALIGLTEYANTYFLRHMDQLVANAFGPIAIKKLKPIYPPLLAGFVLSAAFFMYSVSFIPPDFFFIDPLPMFSGTLWVLMMYFYYEYKIGLVTRNLLLHLATTDNKGNTSLLSIPSIILGIVNAFEPNITVFYDKNGNHYIEKSNKLQSIYDSYFGYLFEKGDGELLFLKSYWEDKNKPSATYFNVLHVLGGISTIALSDIKSVVQENGMYTIVAQSDIFFMPALEKIDILFPADQFEINGNKAWPKDQDPIIFTEQLYELVKRRIPSVTREINIGPK